MSKSTFIPLNLQHFAELVVTAPDDEVPTDVDPADDTDTADVGDDDPQDDPADDPENDPEDDDNLPDLPPEQKNAFQKRLEREQKKLQEKMDQEYRQKYGRHDSIIQQLGGDMDVIERNLQENQWLKEAQQAGYTQEEYESYARQKRMEAELFDLRIDNQINDLRDNATYAGIRDMKKDIKDIIRISNGKLTAQQAYWALGGEARAAQAKREAEQREIAKRAQGKRTVQTDKAGSGSKGPALSPEILQQAKKMGISVEEAQRLMTEEYNNIEDYRKAKQKKRS